MPKEARQAQARHKKAELVEPELVAAVLKYRQSQTLTTAKTRPRWLLGWAGAAVVVLLVAIHRVVWPDSHSPLHPQIHRRAVTHGLAEELRLAAAAGEPVVLTGVDSLPTWGPSDIAGLRLTRVYAQQRSPIFGPYYDASRPLARLGGVQPRHNYTEVTMSGLDFFGAAAGPPWRYYSGEVERDLTPGFLRELRPLEMGLVALRPSRSSVNLWLGRAAGTAPCHFDGYHNAFAQLHGAKRFVVAPPAASALLRPFPFLHPSHAQCQARLGVDGPAATALRQAGSLQVDLAPGELLYLPPLWFHEVVALADAVSVNGWSDSEQGDAAAQLFALRRPSHIHASGDVDLDAAPRRADAPTEAAALIARLSAAAAGAPAALVRGVWRERYAALVAEGELLAPPLTPPPDCAALAPPRHLRAPDEPPEVEAWVRAAADLATTRLPASARHLWLGNLAELVAAEHVGAERAAAFWRALYKCVPAAVD